MAGLVDRASTWDSHTLLDSNYTASEYETARSASEATTLGLRTLGHCGQLALKLPHQTELVLHRVLLADNAGPGQPGGRFLGEAGGDAEISSDTHKDCTPGERHGVRVVLSERKRPNYRVVTTPAAGRYQARRRFEMNDERNGDERGALVLRPEAPRRGRFSLVISDSFCFEVTESGDTVRLDFRPRTIRERVDLWRRKWGL